MSDFPIKTTDFHRIANFDRMVEKNNEARNVVGGDFCNPKPRPTPIAPPKTLKMVKSKPTEDSDIKMAMAMKAMWMRRDKTILRLLSISFAE